MNRHDDAFPRDEQHRYRIYRLRAGANDRERECIAAEPDPQSLGVKLVELGKAGKLADCAVGILDVLGEPDEKWILRPWLPSPRNVSDAGRVLALGTAVAWAKATRGEEA